MTAYRVLSVTEAQNSLFIYYDYKKIQGTVTLAQLFRFRANKICELLLVFDANYRSQAVTTCWRSAGTRTARMGRALKGSYTWTARP